MKKSHFYMLGTTTLLLLSGCGSSSSTSEIPSKEPATINKKESRTVDITVLGLAQEWQKEPVEKNWNEANSYCSSLSLEGKSDWRLPSSSEFFALLDNNSSIDEQFPQSSSIKEFWTSDETAFDDTKAWKIASWSNSEAYKDKKSVLGVRCVRGDAFSQHNFVSEDDILTDITSSKELRWQDDQTSSLVLLSFDDAKDYCEAKSQRLPTIFEYQSVVDKKSLTTPFHYIKENDFTSYWSDTAEPTNDKQVLTLNFMTGGVTFNSKDALNHVKCVKQINHAPTVEINQSVSLVEDSEIEILLQAEDSDNDSLTTTITQTPSHGTYINNIYKPDTNFNGVDVIKYKVSDKTFTSSEATIMITVTSINDAPIAQDVNLSTTEDVPKSFSLEVSDIDSLSLSFVIDTDVSHGTLTQSGDTFTYTPAADYVGDDSFTYRAFDGSDYSTVQTVLFSVLASNDAPVADSQTITLDEDSAKSIILTGSDIDSDMLNFSILSQPSNGQLTGTAPNLIYTPNANYFGDDSFTFKTSDAALDSTVATVNITVNAVNDAPFVNNLNLSTDEDTAKNIIFLVQDIDSTTINYHIKSQPSNGTLTGTMPTVTYTPNANFNGTDSFVYYADDGSTNSVDATVTISVGVANNAPIADAKSVMTIEDTDITITLGGSDTENSPLTYILTSQPAHGTIVQNENIVIYTPNANYAGVDSFSYKVNDGTLDSAVVFVSISIDAINDKPLANSLSITTNEDTAKDITLVGSDIESSSLIYNTTMPSHGILSGSGDSRVYTPNANYYGDDSFTYTVNDGIENSDTATVTIFVSSINDAPTADAQTITLDEDSNTTIILTGDDIDTTTLSYEVVSQPSHGTLSISDANVTIYTPSANYYGSDSFTFKTYDGTDYSQSATVTISVNAVNDIPVIQPISQINTAEDTEVTIHLLASDEDNDTLTYVATSPSNGTLSGSGADRTYTPASNYHGSDSFDVFVQDSESNSTTITVVINITDVNDAPTANAGVDVSVEEGVNVTLSASNSFDIDGTIASYTWLEDNTTLSTSISFDKNDFSVGTHTLTLQVQDNEGEIDVDEVVVTIEAATISSIFNAYTITTAIKASQWLEMVDVDNDGDLDILSAARDVGASNIAWYENKGEFTNFQEHIIVQNDGSDFKHIKAADLDNDGLLDIVYASHDTTNPITICTNKGDKTFTCQNPISTSMEVDFLDIVDVDNDKKLDIVSLSLNDDSVAWYKNEGDSFSLENVIDSGDSFNGISSLTHSDVDGDKDMDILISVSEDDTLLWYKNDGSGNFTKETIDATNSALKYYTSVVAVDIDNDGKDDVVSSSFYTKEIVWLKNNNETFASPVIIDSNMQAYYASAVDMDNDGDSDILAASPTEIVWYENEQNGTTFTKHITVSGLPSMERRAFAADMDNDGYMDIVSGDEIGKLIVYENSASDTITLLPKTGDIDDGGFGGDYSFTRDDSTEIVTDALTGLMWQDDAAVSSGPKYWDDVQGACEQVSVGNYHDWRFPNRHELYYLAQKNSSILDTTFENSSYVLKDYWTSSEKEIYISFAKATSNLAKGLNYTRCVRGKELKFNYIREDSHDVVLDKRHNLMWEDASESENRTSDFSGALNGCASLDYLGYSDWRLPNIHELDTLFDDNGFSLAFQYTGDQQNDTLISATYYLRDTDTKAYAMEMSTGVDTQINTSASYKYRCVRNIQ